MHFEAVHDSIVSARDQTMNVSSYMSLTAAASLYTALCSHKSDMHICKYAHNGNMLFNIHPNKEVITMH
jgi:hypothetical protein